MNTALLRLLLVLLLCGGMVPKLPLYQRFALGGYWYDMRLQKQYEHDEDAYVTYFVVSRAKKNKNLCSAIYHSIRRGAVLASGSVELTPHRLQFTTRYADAKRHIRISNKGTMYVSPDSSRTIFLPDGRGGLRLAQAQEFRSGEVTTYNY